jgi:hypothetical protein
MTTLITAPASGMLTRVLTTGWAATNPTAPNEQRLHAAAAATAAWHAAERAPARARITCLIDQLEHCQRVVDEAAAAHRALRVQLDRFRVAVRRRVIDAVNDRQVCRPGANDALADWDMPTLRVSYDATVEVGLVLAVTAADPDSAEEAARQVIHDECAALTDTTIDPVYDIDIDQVQPPEPNATGTHAATHRVTATLRVHLTVVAADEDDAADVDAAMVRDRSDLLRRVETFDPVCIAADDASDGYLDPDHT